jgi:GTP-binding protein
MAEIQRIQRANGLQTTDYQGFAMGDKTTPDDVYGMVALAIVEQIWGLSAIFDSTLKPILMLAFFAAVGLSADLSMLGKGGKRVIGRVPPGTVVYRANAATVQEAVEFERSEDGVDLEPIADLTETGQEFVLCKGGEPGKGNWNFKTATNRTPIEHTLGTPGDLGVFYLELRRIADAGLVGFPNAGKSTLIGKLSAAKPKVASYPFTTLQPVVGVVEFPGFRRCTIADIPGLIEGAHENRGLGHEFLRHITRCRVLLFVLDMAVSEGRDPLSDLEILRREIKEYDEELSRFPWKVIANKMDLEGAAENLTAFKQRFPKVEVIPISAELEEGLDDLKQILDNEVGHKLKD